MEFLLSKKIGGGYIMLILILQYNLILAISEISKKGFIIYFFGKILKIFTETSFTKKIL